MQESESQLKAIADVLDVVECSNTEQEKTVGIKACLQLLNELKDAGLDNSELYYLLGYAWYLSPNSSARSKNILSFLSRALELNFEHQMAKVYLCHHLFDEQMYQEFLKHYQQIQRYRLTGWRKLKFSEMNIIAKIALNTLDAQELAWYIKDYESAEETDQPVISEIFVFSKGRINDWPVTLSQFIEKWSRFWDLKH